MFFEISLLSVVFMMVAQVTDPSSTTIMIVAVVSAVLGMGVVKLLGYLRKRDAEKEAQLILEKAELQAGSRLKEAKVEAREMALQEKAKIDEQVSTAREKVFARERQLDKQHDQLDQRTAQLEKQEKMVEGNQRKLS